jgi:hypothetical protein
LHNAPARAYLYWQRKDFHTLAYWKNIRSSSSITSGISTLLVKSSGESSFIFFLLRHVASLRLNKSFLSASVLCSGTSANHPAIKMFSGVCRQQPAHSTNPRHPAASRRASSAEKVLHIR